MNEDAGTRPGSGSAVVGLPSGAPEAMSVTLDAVEEEPTEEEIRAQRYMYTGCGCFLLFFISVFAVRCRQAIRIASQHQRSLLLQVSYVRNFVFGTLEWTGGAGQTCEIATATG